MFPGRTVSLLAVTTPTITGEEKRVFAFCKKRHNNIALTGCTLYLVHTSAEKVADSLPMSA